MLSKAKKTIALLICMSIAIGLFLPSLLLVIEASETSSSTQEPFMVDYFSHLDSFGINLLNTCSMVALEMLLTYYDCYWDDRLVADDYIQYTPDFNHTMAVGYPTYASPGSPDPLTDDEIEFYVNNRVDNLTNTFYTYLDDCVYGYDVVSLHMLLIRYAFENNLLVMEKGGQLSAEKTKQLLEKYIEIRDNAHFEFSANDWEITLDSYEAYVANREALNQEAVTPDIYESTMRARVIDCIQNGYPVCIFVSYYENGDFTTPVGGHTMIAYDYDATTETIYGHYGWPSSANNYNPHGDYRQLSTDSSITETIVGYLKMTPTDEHVHSNDYVFSDYPTGACSCQLPSHTHEYYAYGNQESAGHYALCYCEYYELQEHMHTDTYIYYSESSHYAICCCGHSELQNHSYQAQGLGKKVCVYCGHTVSILPDTPVVSPLADFPPIDGHTTNNEEKKE